MPSILESPASKKLNGLDAAAKHARTLLAPYAKCECVSGEVKNALASVREGLDYLLGLIGDIAKDNLMVAEIREDISRGLTHDGICLSEMDRLDMLDRELQAEKDAADLQVMGNIEGTPKGKDEPAAPLYWKFTPDVDVTPTPAPEPFHSIHPSNCGCDGCVNRGLREVQDAVRRMPTTIQAIDIRRPA